MDVSLQANYYVFTEQEVERLGGKKIYSLDVRVIATTNRDLADYVVKADLAETILYYRLNVFPLRWCQIRERKGGYFNPSLITYSQNIWKKCVFWCSLKTISLK